MATGRPYGSDPEGKRLDRTTMNEEVKGPSHVRGPALFMPNLPLRKIVTCRAGFNALLNRAAAEYVPDTLCDRIVIGIESLLNRAERAMIGESELYGDAGVVQYRVSPPLDRQPSHHAAQTRRIRAVLR